MVSLGQVLADAIEGQTVRHQITEENASPHGSAEQEQGQAPRHPGASSDHPRGGSPLMMGWSPS